MAKLSIELPKSFSFKTEIPVLIQHVNRANHLANEHLVAMLNEARTRFSASLDWSQSVTQRENFINADLAVIYKAEAHYGDELIIEVAAADFSRFGCDYLYRVSKKADGRLVAIAKTAMLHFNYQLKRLEPVSPCFASLFPTEDKGFD